MSFTSQSRHHRGRLPRSGFDNRLIAFNASAAGQPHPNPDLFYQIPYYAAQPPLKRRRSNDDRPDRCYLPSFPVWDGGIGNSAPSTSHVFFHHQPRRNHGEVAGGGGGTWRMPMTAAVLAPEEPGEAFVSKDEIERCSPSRKDGIDSVLETQLRYSYCSYLQRLGTRLQLPQTTTATAIVLCHRFFFHRSHACHDRFLISTAALFLSAKSEETPCLLNSVLRASCEVSQEMELPYGPYMFHSQDWFQQYRERVIEAEQLILTTLDFELDVEHPYVPLTSVLKKLGLSETALLNVALNLISEGLRSLLWLQFKPRHIAAGAAVLAAKFLNHDLAFNPSFWHAFKTTPSVLEDIVQQLKELL